MATDKQIEQIANLTVEAHNAAEELREMLAKLPPEAIPDKKQQKQIDQMRETVKKAEQALKQARGES